MNAARPGLIAHDAGHASWPLDTTGQDPHAQRKIDLVPLHPDWLERVAEVEKTAYAHPWTLRHFRSSLDAGHPTHALVMAPDPALDPAAWAHAPTLPDGRWLLGYLVAMPGVGEVHLLNITTVPAHRRQGWGRLMLQVLIDWSRRQGAEALWLEVRAGNQPARALYDALGFRQVGVRKGYYPDAGPQREDAIVMVLPLTGTTADAHPAQP